MFIFASYMAALLSKETAAAVPIFVFLFVVLNSSSTEGRPGSKERLKKGAVVTIPFMLPLIIYFLLRFNSDAFTPFNSPAYYSYTFAPYVLLKNISEYIICAGLLDLYIAIVIIIIGGLSTFKRNPPGKRIDWSVPALGLLWFLCFLLPPLPLSSRSDLYTYFPQIGLHVMFLSFFTSLFHIRNIEDRKKNLHRFLLIISMGVLSAVWMGYLWIKAESSSKTSKNSALFTNQMVEAGSQIAPGSRILIIDTQVGDECSPLKTIAYGFNPMLNLYYPHKHLTGTIISFDKVSEIKGKDKEFDGVLYFIWKNNQLIRTSPK